MADWTPEVQLAVDIAFALRNVKIPVFARARGRFTIAQTIVEHLKLCRWEFSKPAEAMQ